MNHPAIVHLWQRSRTGPLGGVCEGLGKSFGVDPKLLRFLWLISVLLFGSGLLLYALLYFVLPAEDEIEDYQRPKILGVCYHFARHYRLDLGLLRFVALLIFFGSFGSSLLVYGILYFFAPKEPV